MLPAWSVAVLCASLGALLASRLVDGGSPRDRWLWAVALGPAVGFGLLATLSFLRLQSGKPQLEARPFLLIVLAVALLLSRRRVRRGRPRPTRAPRWLRAAALALLLVSAVAGALGYLRMSRAYPGGSWDAVAIWDTRALFFHRAPQRFPALIGKLESTSHPQYPPLLPAALSGEYALAADEGPAISSATGAVFFLGLAALVVVATATLAELWVGALGASLLLTLPIVMVWAPSHCADLPAAYFLLAASAGLACLGCRGRARPASVLVGFCLGMLTWVKDEGAVLAALCLAAWGLQRWRANRRGSRSPRQWLGLLAGAAPGILVLILFKAAWPAVTPASFMGRHALEYLGSGERWAIPARAMAARLLLPGQLWPHAWWSAWLPALVSITAPGKRAPAPWLLVTVQLAALGVFWAVYVVSPYDQAWHIDASLDRVLLQLFPTALVGGLALLHAVLRDNLSQSSSKNRR